MSVTTHVHEWEHYRYPSVKKNRALYGVTQCSSHEYQLPKFFVSMRNLIFTLMKTAVANLELFSAASRSSLVTKIMSHTSYKRHPKLLLNIILPRLVQILDVSPAIVRYCMVFLSPSTQIPVLYLMQATTASFRMCPSSLSNHPTAL